MTRFCVTSTLVLVALVTSPHSLLAAQDPTAVRRRLAEADQLRAQRLREPVEQSIPVYRRVIEEAARARLVDVTAAAELGLGQSLDWFGKCGESREHHRRAADRYRELGQQARQAEALVYVARCQFDTGDAKAAQATIDAALAMARQAGDRRVLALALDIVGNNIPYADVERWRPALDEAIAINRADGYLIELAECLRDLGYKLQMREGSAASQPVFTDALAAARASGDARAIGSSLSLLALSTRDMNESIALYLESLPYSRRTGHDTQIGYTLSGIGIRYYENGQYSRALERFQEALAIRRSAGLRAELGENLNNVGAAMGMLGRRTERVPYLEEALQLHREFGYLDGQAVTLVNLTSVAVETGNPLRAVGLAQEALEVARRAGNRRNEAMAHQWIAHAYLNLGRYRDAVAEYDAALTSARAMQDDTRIAGAERALARTWALLGNRDQAIDHYGRALAIAERTKNAPDTAVITSHLALFKAEAGDFAGVDATMDRAIALGQTAKSPSAMMRIYDRAGTVALLRGDSRRAIRMFELEVDAIRQMGQAEGLAAALTQLGRAHASRNDRTRALQFYDQALAASAVANDPAVEAMTLVALMDAWRAERRWNLSAFFGKQAVDIFQAARTDLSRMDDTVQRRFLDSRADVYRDLADVLISGGRLIEAQQVLDLLKQEEFQDFVRRSGAQAATRSVLTATETRALERYREIQDRVMELGRKRRELVLIKQRSAAEEEALKSLETDLEAANTAFDVNLKQLVADFGRNPVAADRAEMIREAQPVMEDLRNIGDGSVLVYVLVTTERTRLMLITADARKSVTVEIDEATLNHRIQTFRRVLQNPKLDPRPAGYDLYRVMVEPIAHDLEQARAQSIVWVLDRALRYVPMAAMYDGKKYLAESYRSVIATPASERRFTTPALSTWSGLGVGVSKSVEGFVGLPFVSAELQSIFAGPGGSRGGFVPGRVLLDDAFTEAAFRSGLRGQSSVVHIASHFRFQPGNDEDSFLLLGDGSHFTLAQINRQNQLFEGVELVTLSACETAVGDVGATGTEVESLGVLAQRQGAKAVIAGLWSVADESTRVLMEAFYRGKVEQSFNKAEALRQAQLAMLTGRAAPTSPTIGRRGLTVPPAAGDKPFTPPANAPWAHPYYWAPFILIGNWR